MNGHPQPEERLQREQCEIRRIRKEIADHVVRTLNDIITGDLRTYPNRQDQDTYLRELISGLEWLQRTIRER